MKRISQGILLAAVLLLGAFYLRTLFEASRALGAAEQAESGSRRLELLADAISWDGLFNPFSRRARSLLEERVSNAAQSPEDRLAAIAALRRGLASSRSFVNPRAADLAELEVLERELSNSPAPPVRSLRTPVIHYEFQLLSQLAFWAWLGTVVWMIFSAFTPEGRFLPQRMRAPLAACAASFALWLAALWQA